MEREQYDKAVTLYTTSLKSMRKSDKTIRLYAGVLNRFGDWMTDEDKTVVNSVTILEWREYLFSSEVSNNSIRQYLTCLQVFFNWCIGKKMIAENPMDEKPSLQEVDYDLLSLEEINLLFADTNKVPTPISCRNRAIIVLLLESGLRNAELRNLRLSDLDFENKVIHVQHGKGDKERYVPFPSKARTEIEKYLNSGVRPKRLTADDWLFGTDADSKGHKTHGKIWKQYSSAGLLQMVEHYVRKLTGHSHIGVHDLRHAFASYTSNSGASTRVISLALGHADERITNKVYISVLDKSKAAITLNSLLDENV